PPPADTVADHRYPASPRIARGPQLWNTHQSASNAPTALSRAWTRYHLAAALLGQASMRCPQCLQPTTRSTVTHFVIDSRTRAVAIESNSAVCFASSRRFQKEKIITIPRYSARREPPQGLRLRNSRN